MGIPTDRTAQKIQMCVWRFSRNIFFISLFIRVVDSSRKQLFWLHLKAKWRQNGWSHRFAFELLGGKRELNGTSRQHQGSFQTVCVYEKVCVCLWFLQRSHIDYRACWWWRLQKPQNVYETWLFFKTCHCQEKSLASTLYISMGKYTQRLKFCFFSHVSKIV